MLTTQEVINEIIPILDNSSIRRASLFGDYARNEQNRQSVVDILVDCEVYPCDMKSLKYNLEFALNNRVNLINYYNLYVYPGILDLSLEDIERDLFYFYGSSSVSIYEWNKNKFKFPNKDCIGYPYFHIHPYKQDAVQYLVKNKPDWVTHIIIFGSSVTTAHLWYKDLDVCLIGDYNEDHYSYRDCKLPDINYDFLKRKSLQHLIESSKAGYPVYIDILEKGVMVYEKI